MKKQQIIDIEWVLCDLYEAITDRCISDAKIKEIGIEEWADTIYYLATKRDEDEEES